MTAVVLCVFGGVLVLILGGLHREGIENVRKMRRK